MDATSGAGWRVGMAAALCALLAGTAAAQAPAPTGEHAVGRRVVHWVDESRRDPVDPSRPRELMVWLWYPAAPSPGAPAELALPGEWGERHAAESAPKIGERAAAALRALRVAARTDAPLAPSPHRLPVLLFTPGLGWLPSDYSALVEEMASHGYLVVGVAPPGSPTSCASPTAAR